MDRDLFKTRVKGRVHKVRTIDAGIIYATDDQWEFLVPVEDTRASGGGDTPKFLDVDKGAYFMRWIRKAMEKETGNADR